MTEQKDKTIDLNSLKADAVLAESIKREQKYYKIYENYQVTPSFQKSIPLLPNALDFVMCQTPNQVSVGVNEEEDCNYIYFISQMSSFN
jgi:hypothetical protein